MKKTNNNENMSYLEILGQEDLDHDISMVVGDVRFTWRFCGEGGSGKMTNHGK